MADTDKEATNVPRNQKDNIISQSQSRVQRLSNAVEKTVDKLSRSVSVTSSPTRVFSLSRKSRSPQLLSEGEGSRAAPSSEDSPFIRPVSPPLRPKLDSFRGDGSMRAGTQTLIQALQALPWMTDNDDENINGPDVVESESEDEGRPQLERLSSSIHTIHRPLARSNRRNIPVPSNRSSKRNEEDLLEDISTSDDEIENDFEEASSSPDALSSQMRQKGRVSPKVGAPRNLFEVMGERAGSVATIRLHRRTRLAEKLKEVYELDDVKEVFAEMPCWLLRSVLLQGYMYLTNSYLCFFAHMPSREDQVLKSGSLNKKAQRTKRWIKHWFILKNDALSWYQSSSDPYFPRGIVDLRYAVSCDPVGEKGFRLRTNSKTVVLSADSVPSREEWVKAIKKVIFKAQNMGDSVKIAIPYSAILDVERSTAMDFSETIEVKVVDKEDHFAIDSYFFAYFRDLPGALDQIRCAVRTYRTSCNPPENTSTLAVLDTTISRSPTTPDRAVHTLPEATSPKATAGFRLASIFRPFTDSFAVNRASTLPSELQNDDYTHVSHKPGSSSFVPITTSKLVGNTPSFRQPDEPNVTLRHSAQSLPPPDHTDNNNSWAVGVPSWLKSSRRVFVPSLGVDFTATFNSTLVKEVYSSAASSPGPVSRPISGGEMAFSILETPDIKPDQETAEKFRAAFAYDEKETLLGYFPGYIYRLLPVFGKLYISTNHFCFKSSGPLAARTRMTLPIRDILALEKSKASRFGHHGLVIIVKGHEELFFEFGADDKRDLFVQLLERQMEDVRIRLATGEASIPSSGKQNALILEEFEAGHSTSTDSDPAPPADNMADSLPAVMFTSASSTFLTFKPKKSLHFTFLTIGSRGDVQPYIALAKGLIADGHKCRIATHGEFREWIVSHGIEFGFVGGDPAELLRICVENGLFTVSFLKEALQKFRGWLDDLLITSWEACQGTDVLVESPSAMGGYHIAEALAIPYFRAFTMTWTRTRAYPHAFAVPERKMGGSYNYMSYVMFDQVFWRAIAGQINRWRRNLLYLGPTSLDKMEPHKIPFLYNFSPHVVPPPLDWPEWIRVTGYWFLNDADVSATKWTPPPSLLQFIENAHKKNVKVVYIGFGSIVVQDPKAMTRCIVESVLRSGVHAILSKGWSDRLQAKGSGDAVDPEELFPPEIYPITSIPHDWLFQRIDAACHHGGAGTTGASLRAGIPTIIHPFFGDQFFWADRVEALGVGASVRKLTVSSLSEALIAATTDYKQVDRAKTIGEQIRGEDGVATAVESIYRDLEYARSLIKQHHGVDDLEGISEVDGEESTIRNHDNISPSSLSGYSSVGSVRGAPSEDWSVISEQDGRKSSVGSRKNEGRAKKKRRGSPGPPVSPGSTTESP